MMNRFLKALCLLWSTGTLLTSCSSGDETEQLPPTKNPSNEEDQKEESRTFPVAEIVDMGLSVCWASWNMGDSSTFEGRHAYGWGDQNGSNTGSSLDDYPCPFPPTNISGTQYDIATQQWGEGWRLPTKQEFSELWYNSDVAIGEVEGLLYYSFTSCKNGQTIYLPYKAGVCSVNALAYWTSELDSKDTRNAYATYAQETTDLSWVYLLRSDRAYVRPVYEKTRIRTLEATNIEAKRATLNGDLSWYVSVNKEETGFYFSTEQAEIEAPGPNTRKIAARDEDQAFYASVTDLTRNTDYYYRAYATVNGKEYRGDVVQFTTLNAYEVGELWPDDNNPEGVVFDISDEGLHGKIVAFDQTNRAWQPGIPIYVIANDSDDGSKNQFPSSVSLNDWIKDHGAEWYCPARNELRSLSGVIQVVNITFRALGYEPLENFYWSSTQYSPEYYDLAYMVVVTENGTYSGYRNSWSTYNSKNQIRGVIAVKKF